MIDLLCLRASILVTETSRGAQRGLGALERACSTGPASVVDDHHVRSTQTSPKSLIHVHAGVAVNRTRLNLTGDPITPLFSTSFSTSSAIVALFEESSFDKGSCDDSKYHEHRLKRAFPSEVCAEASKRVRSPARSLIAALLERLIPSRTA